MEKEFVPYEWAVKLKELGFNEPCFGYYKAEYEDGINPLPINLILEQNKASSNVFYKTSAPLYQQAFRWFRKKYDLWSCIQKYPTSENPNRCYYELKGDNINTDKDESPNSYMSGWFNSYEEAELACLNKLIEIVEKELIN